ncbi:hypothetical protein HGM15179_003248 [Zosterops borbonicus]|uniref:Uncharacterized protein n=1 Tax=Zosterops borbonicus TaxID=364589 RepID=A0A8K1GTN0_9PASS|nr:hypothetical protein HGM15179_003248 [Zosterops borbonicus]
MVPSILECHLLAPRPACLSRDTPVPGDGCRDRLGNERLDSSAGERDLGILVCGQLNMSQQCPGSQEGQPCPGDIRHSITSQTREGIVPLCSGVASPRVLGASFGHHNTRRLSAIRECPKEAMRMVKGLEGNPYEEQLRSLGLFSLDTRRLKEDFTAVTTSL